MRQGNGRRARARATLAGAIALVLLASLVPAQAAGASSLSERAALRTAAKLLDQELRERGLLQARISLGERVNRNTFRFLYDDLSRRGEVCTAVIEVKVIGRRPRTIQARFMPRTNCETPGSEALAFRSATRTLARRFEKRGRSVLRSVIRYIEGADECESLQVPQDRRDEVFLLLNAGLTKATIRPLNSALDAHVSSLEAVSARDAQLAAGAAAWRSYLDAVRTLPKLQPSYCGAIVEWARNGYSDETAPVDFAALRSLAAGLQDDAAELRRTGRHLHRLGLDRVTAGSFSLDDLLGTSGIGDPASLDPSMARVIAP